VHAVVEPGAAEHELRAPQEPIVPAISPRIENADGGIRLPRECQKLNSDEWLRSASANGDTRKLSGPSRTASD
jgi:hypothetical protein